MSSREVGVGRLGQGTVVTRGDITDMTIIGGEDGGVGIVRGEGVVVVVMRGGGEGARGSNISVHLK